MMQSVGRGKGVGSMKIVPNQRTRACIMSALLGANAVGHPSAKDLVNLVVPQSDPA